MLVQRSQVGSVIGQKGQKIKETREVNLLGDVFWTIFSFTKKLYFKRSSLLIIIFILWQKTGAQIKVSGFDMKHFIWELNYISLSTGDKAGNCLVS